MASSAPARKRLRAATSEPPEETSLALLMRELREMREEQARRQEEYVDALRRCDEEMGRLRENVRQLRELRVEREQAQKTLRQLSPPLNPLPPRELESRLASAGQGDVRGAAGRDVRVAAGQDVREAAGQEMGYKLKPDTFDGTVPLREFLSQFDLIACANRWSDSTKTVALASSLRGKARSVLETVQDLESLNFAELRSKLELRFGEANLAQSYYSQFVNRKQGNGEDLAAYGSELERLSRLAYPECLFAVRDKIACAQFVSSLADGFLRRTLQLEGITSLELAIERAKAVKIIQGGNSEGGGEGRRFEKGDSLRAGEGKVKGKNGGKVEGKEGKKRECWTCGGSGHFRSECPGKKGDEGTEE